MTLTEIAALELGLVARITSWSFPTVRVQYAGDGAASDIAHFLQRAQPGTRAAGAAVQAMRREAAPVLYQSARPFSSDRLK